MLSSEMSSSLSFQGLPRTSIKGPRHLPQMIENFARFRVRRDCFIGFEVYSSIKRFRSLCPVQRAQYPATTEHTVDKTEVLSMVQGT